MCYLFKFITTEFDILHQTVFQEKILQKHLKIQNLLGLLAQKT